ncbi:chemotaxis protein [Lysobacteraceae bacterium NML93-0792]|nr:chemotaxis protein [Xanthomonadaceae bacterium NML93-0792]PBS16203.1 chemotaxis protein [Xanthomonadaceae bacterium NML93-0793]PBS20229.1 chemotaxis protein [Xanthomonadaceae bacterium NML93-0831]
MTALLATFVPHPARGYAAELSTRADRLFLLLGALLTTSSGVIALINGSWTPFWTLALPAFALMAAHVWLAPGARVTRIWASLMMMTIIAVTIHQSRGLVEMHFGIFVVLALLLYYRDWAPVLAGAVYIAAHHVLLFWLQSRGLPYYGFAPGSGAGVLALHAGFVVVETAVVCVMAVQLRRELDALGHSPHMLADVARGVVEGHPAPAQLRDSRLPAESLAAALVAMGDRVVARMDADRALIAENLRIRTALDSVTTNVMIADTARDIVYVNRSLREMLATAESDIRKALPTFNAASLIGTNIDGFHKAPDHQAAMLSRLRETHRAQILVGGRSMRLIITPILDAAGQSEGFVVEWADRTDEVSVEAEVSRIVAAAAAGDLSGRIATEGKQGFLLQLAQQLNSLLDANTSSLAQVSRVLTALAHGDLTVRMDGDFQGVFAQMRDDANATVTQLTGIVARIQEASNAIGTASSEIAAGNNDLSQRTEQQAANLEETAASMEELTSTVRQNADSARQANQLVIGTADVASKGGSVVGQVVTTMAEIEASSKRIGDIISVIDGIAFQTNILALNAAVEAARAGEQGRGFAVVASEVRTLAQRSAQAAKEIKGLIDDSTSKVSDGAALAGQAGKTMGEIVSSVQRVTDIMSEIAAASQEQAAGIEQVNQTITQMDETTQQNAALVEEASAAARAMEEQAASLSETVAIFRVDGAPGPAQVTVHGAPASARGSVPSPKRRAPAAPRPTAAPKPQQVTSEAEWAEF